MFNSIIDEHSVSDKLLIKAKFSLLDPTKSVYPGESKMFMCLAGYRT